MTGVEQYKVGWQANQRAVPATYCQSVWTNEDERQMRAKIGAEFDAQNLYMEAAGKLNYRFCGRGKVESIALSRIGSCDFAQKLYN